MLDLYSIRTFVGELHESCADRRVHQLSVIAHKLDLRIDDAMFVREEGWKLAHEDIAVLVDGRSEHGTSVLLVPSRIVGAAAEKRDAIGCPRDDHDRLNHPYAERAPSFGRDNLVRLFQQSPPQPHLCHALQVSARRPTEALRDGGEVARALEIFMEGVVPEAQDLRGR